MENWEAARNQLVENFIKTAGVSDERVIKTLSTVPRHLFVPLSQRWQAYQDIPLSIGRGQTISQPSLVAVMTQALRLSGREKVLEIGTGSGYQAAILSLLANQVFSIERIKPLARKAQKLLQRLGYANVEVIIGNGTIGLSEKAPFDAIMVTAGATSIPQPLVDQLKEEGRMVIPVGDQAFNQKLMMGIKHQGQLRLEEIEPVRFVPLIGKYGADS